MRAFFAIPFSAEEHELLGSLQESLATMPALDDFRWVRTGNIHITLRFLGDIEDKQAEVAAEALRRAGEGACTFDISVDRFGVFPHLKRPNVLWAGPSETPEPLAELEANLSRHLWRSGASRYRGYVSPALDYWTPPLPRPPSGRTRGRARNRGTAMVDAPSHLLRARGGLVQKRTQSHGRHTY